MTAAPDAYLQHRYAAKDADYYGGARQDFVRALPDEPHAHILEIGCGNGATGALALATGKCARYVGVEMFAPMADAARAVLSEVHQGNVEAMALPFAPASFDALVMSEVLEHLTDPAAVMGRLSPLLKPGARVFASSPNIAHWRIVRDLLRGRFDYADSGVMDRTHLHWFTPDSFRRLFADAGIAIDAWGPPGTVPQPPRGGAWARLQQLRWGQINVHGHKI
jgi:2-polyprenyl-3-methyl-5-hydroxy-6-metoxy-1,4-benzoquinol methylase